MMAHISKKKALQVSHSQHELLLLLLPPLPLPPCRCCCCHLNLIDERDSCLGGAEP